MKRFIIGGLTFLLAAASPALADHHRGGGGAPHRGSSRPAMHMSHPGAHFARPRAVRERGSLARVRRPSTHGWHVTGRTRHWSGGHARHFAHHRSASTHRFARVRRAVQAHHRFHVGVYHRPHGWYRHHWRIGERLPRGWFARNYWISDWGLYGLWAPVDGLVWVRVGPDAMLIDPETGEVVAVNYGVFW